MSESALPAVCENIELKIRLPSLKCDQSILPDFGNLSDFGRQLGSIPGQLGRMSVCLVGEQLAALRAATEQILQALESVFGEFPWSVPTPLWGNLKAPEWEMELKLSAMFQEFKIYLITKMLEILGALAGAWLQIPIPFVPGCVLGDLLTAEGRTKIRNTISDQLDGIAQALGLPWDFTFSGELGLNSPEARAQMIVSRIYSEIIKTLNNVLHAALGALIQAFQRIWNSLGLPALVALLSIDFEALFDSIWNQVKDQAISMQEKLERVINFFLDLDLKNLIEGALGSIANLWPFPFSVRALLEKVEGLLNAEYNLVSPEIRFARIMNAVKALFENLTTLIMEIWLQAVTVFIQRVIAPLMQYIPFTICTFLSLVAAPLFALPQLVGGLIPAPVQVEYS
jgi:AcrR family transcriptional regulator